MDNIDWNESMMDARQACYDRLTDDGINLSMYNSAQNAADVAALRTALDYEEVNLFGISYGTRLGLTIMRDHPEGIRSVILDSVYPPQVNGYEQGAYVFYRALRRVFNDCATDAACDAAYPDLEQVFYKRLRGWTGRLSPWMCRTWGQVVPARCF